MTDIFEHNLLNSDFSSLLFRTVSGSNQAVSCPAHMLEVPGLKPPREHLMGHIFWKPQPTPYIIRRGGLGHSRNIAVKDY